MEPTQTIPKHRGKGLLGYSMGFVGNSPKFASDMEAEMGNVFLLTLPKFDVMVVFHPAVIKHILQTNARNYPKSPNYKYLSLFLGNGLVTSEGELWRKQRKLAQPAFHKKYLANLVHTMWIETVDYVEDLRSRSGGTEPLDMAHEMMLVTANVVVRTMFSSSNKRDTERMYGAMSFLQKSVMRRIYRPYSWPLMYLNGDIKRFKKYKAEQDQLIDDMIAARISSGDRPHDLLTMLLESIDEETGQRMSDEQLRDELNTIYIAGHETSANAMAWGLYLLSSNPEVVEKLREEEKQVLNGTEPNFEQVMQLNYTRQVIEEVMRLYPPAYSISRMANEADEVEGIRIKKGQLVHLSIYALHRSPKYWDDPLKFDPDRFSPEAVKEREKGVYMPFGAGARMCIGNNFAMMEMQLLLSQLVRHFDFTLAPDAEIDLQPIVTLKPRYGIPMFCKPRQV